MTMFEGKRILVVVAHPDDELLGQGATIHRLVREGSVCKAVILGEGITSRSDVRDVSKWEKELERHHNNMESARKCIGYQEIEAYDFSDNRFDSHDLLDIVKVIEKEKDLFKPDFIFTHHGGDVNIDHQITFQAVITATRPMSDEMVKGVITFETPSTTEWQSANSPFRFTPNLFVSLTEEDVLAKIKGMECYQYESRQWPHPRSSEALMTLAKCRGFQMGVDYAEAFMISRLVY